jgi:hypothetical protein
VGAVVEPALVAFAPAPQVGQKVPRQVVTHERVQKSPHARSNKLGCSGTRAYARWMASERS